MRPFLTLLLILNNCFYFTGETLKPEFSKTDTITYRLMVCGLYMSPYGEIVYKTEMLLNEQGDRAIRYLNEIYNTNPHDSEWVGKSMNLVIDTLTFQFLSDVFWMDKNNIYVLEPMSDGGHINVFNTIDRNTFHVFENSWYGKDKNNIYFKGFIIKGADIKTFQVFDEPGFEFIACDKKSYYYCNSRITEKDAKSLGLDKLKKRKF